MNKCVVVDGNNVVYRSYFAMANSNLTVDGHPSGALYGTIVALRTYLRELKPTHMVWFFDNGKSDLRTGLREDYKGHRKYASTSAPVVDPQADIPPQIEAFEEFLATLKILSYSELGVEADDLIAQAAINWPTDECEMVIVSSDHDLLQLLRPGVSVFRPGESGAVTGSRGLKARSNGKLYGVDEAVEKYGLPPTKLAEMWALTGDSGDNIAGIPGVGPKTAAKWIAKHSDLPTVLIKEPKCEGYERLCYTNWQMIQLDGSVGKIPFGLDASQIPPLDNVMRYRALAFLAEWDMKSIHADFGSVEPW